MNSKQVSIIISFLAVSLLPLKIFSFPHSTATSETTVQVASPDGVSGCPLTNPFPGFPIDFLNDNTGWIDYTLDSNMELVGNGDGTLTITGSLINGTPVDFGAGSNGTSCGASDSWELSLTLSDKKTWAEWQATTTTAGFGQANVNGSCAGTVEEDLDYWDAAGVLTGIGCNAGRTLVINKPLPPYRFQIGYGGNNGDNTCAYSLSTWFDITENGQDLNADIYAFLNEVCMNENLFSTIDVTTIVTTTGCGGGIDACDISIDLTATRGTSPYTFQWADGPTSEDRTMLCNGDYAVTVTDANNSTATTSLTIHLLDGLVFEDFNYNGIEENGEPGRSGIEVNVYDCNNNLVGTTITDTNGYWGLTSGISGGEKYRVEFVLPSDIAAWASPTQAGTDNGTMIQFVEAGECVNLGIASPADYCQENPLLAVPCYVNGDPTGGGTAGAIDWLVYFRNDNQGEVGEAGHTPPEIKVNGTLIGATWGVAHHRQTQTVLASAVMKRHSGFGQNGTGAIYQINEAGTPSLFIDLNSYANVNTGADTRGGDANNTLPNNYNVANRDINAFQAVGKIGIGDIDLSDDGNFLYAINLNERTLVELAIGNTLTAPTTATVYNIATAIDNLVSGTSIACGTAADYRPWALKYHKGLLYIGVVCSAEDSQNANDLHAYVLSFDPSNPGSGFSQVIDMSMDYDREPAFQSDNPSQTIAGAWRPWALSYTDATILPWRGGAHPSPILADLEFDIDGSLILGFLDRFGMQSGYRQLSTDLGDANADHQGLSAGDIIRFCNVNGTLVQEGQAGCSFNTSPPWTNPGDFVPQGEFYGNDEYFTTITNPSHGHPETGLGSLALLPGNGEVTVGVFDPFVLRSGGIAWWNNTDGSANKEYELYESVDDTSPDGSFSKAVGLGDLEYLCEVAPIEIGNYVWEDTDSDGIQDACESPIEDVILTLYNSSCEIVAIDTSDAKGNYAFNETKLTEYSAQVDTALAANATYYIVISGAIGGNWSTANNELTIGSDEYKLTNTNQGSKDEIDSDGELGSAASACSSITEGYIFTTVTTGNQGEVDHSFDFALKLFVCPTGKCGRVNVIRN